MGILKNEDVIDLIFEKTNFSRDEIKEIIKVYHLILKENFLQNRGVSFGKLGKFKLIEIQERPRSFGDYIYLLPNKKKVVLKMSTSLSTELNPNRKATSIKKKGDFTNYDKKY